jgi:tryptophan halogenase
MRQDAIEKVVIVGGGTAGWMAAAAISKIMGETGLRIELVESDEIGIVGVGEATIPQINLFNAMLGLDEHDFVRATHATYKLGIEFRDWVRPGHHYVHPFGFYGLDMKGVEFHHHWLKGQTLGDQASAGRLFARRGRRAQGPVRPSPARPAELAAVQARLCRSSSTPASTASICAASPKPRAWCAPKGKVVDVEQNGETGFVEALVLAERRAVTGELFIDCSGFRGLLIEQVMKSGFEDWSAWLPNDRALAVPCESGGDANPAHPLDCAQRRLAVADPAPAPDRQRLCLFERHISDDEAAATLARQSRRHAARRPEAAALQGRLSPQGLDQERGRDGARSGLPRAARIDQHPSRPVGHCAG